MAKQSTKASEDTNVSESTGNEVSTTAPELATTEAAPVSKQGRAIVFPESAPENMRGWRRIDFIRFSFFEGDEHLKGNRSAIAKACTEAEGRVVPYQVVFGATKMSTQQYQEWKAKHFVGDGSGVSAAATTTGVASEEGSAAA